MKTSVQFLFIALAFGLSPASAPARNLYVSTANSIYKFTPGGVKSTFAYVYSMPMGLAFDSSGNLYEADEGSGNIYKFTPGGVQSTFASGVAPRGLAFDGSGNLFVSDWTSEAIYEFTPGSTRSTFASGLNGPMGLAFDGSGNLYAADIWSGNVYEFAPSGTRSTFASGLNQPGFLVFDAVPEPSILALVGPGAAMLLISRRRKTYSPSGTTATTKVGCGSPNSL